VVKVVMTIATLVVTMAVGRRVIAVTFDWRLASFAVALLISMLSIMTIGFVIASVVPTARFAQPVGGFVLYPMLFLSGLFFPVDGMSPALRAAARATPMTYAVSLLRGAWTGEPWLAHAVDVGALAVFAALFTAVSARFFRWE
jgi:ABC-2 type transport system permease protein